MNPCRQVRDGKFKSSRSRYMLIDDLSQRIVNNDFSDVWYALGSYLNGSAGRIGINMEQHALIFFINGCDQVDIDLHALAFSFLASVHRCDTELEITLFFP